MKRIHQIILTVLLLAGCKEKVPEVILDEQKMVNVIADLTVIDGYMSTLMYTDSLRIEGRNFYATVYKNHNTTKELFDKSIKFYSRQPVLLDSIYSKANRKLVAKENSLLKIQEKAQRPVGK